MVTLVLHQNKNITNVIINSRFCLILNFYIEGIVLYAGDIMENKINMPPKTTELIL